MGNLLFTDMTQIEKNVAEAERQRAALLEQKERQRYWQHQRELREGLEPGHEPAQLLAWLFLGDRFSARNAEWLKANKIGFVLQLSNVPTPDAMLENFKAVGAEYKRLPAEDVEMDNIILQFPAAVEFIERAFTAFKGKTQENTNVLVFCDEGVSRSPTTVAAYLLHKGWLLKGALTHMLALRPQIAPNKGFFRQLLEEEFTVNGWNSLTEEDYNTLFVH